MPTNIGSVTPERLGYRDFGGNADPGPTPGSDVVVVAKNANFVASIYQPGGVTEVMGARIETPVNRAIVSYWRAATLTEDAAGDPIWEVTLQAPVDSGGYNIVWRTSDPEPSQFEGFVPLSCVDSTPTSGSDDPLNWPLLTASMITPTVQDIADLERSRVVDANGNQLTTFQDSGPPSVPANATAVAGLIVKGVNQVLSRLADRINPEDVPKAQLAAEYATAVLLETSFFRVQGISPQGRGASGQSSNVFTYRTLYEELIEELTTGADAPGEGARLV
jgi:hypothetical protein